MWSLGKRIPPGAGTGGNFKSSRRDILRDVFCSTMPSPSGTGIEVMPDPVLICVRFTEICWRKHSCKGQPRSFSVMRMAVR